MRGVARPLQATVNDFGNFHNKLEKLNVKAGYLFEKITDFHKGNMLQLICSMTISVI